MGFFGGVIVGVTVIYTMIYKFVMYTVSFHSFVSLDAVAHVYV